MVSPPHFNPHAPYGARPLQDSYMDKSVLFQSTCPLRGTTETCPLRFFGGLDISIHMPLTGHDLDARLKVIHFAISIHMPLTGHDMISTPYSRISCSRFQSTCPLRGTTSIIPMPFMRFLFQSTCPLRGTTYYIKLVLPKDEEFQSTCPLRGTTDKETIRGQKS